MDFINNNREKLIYKLKKVLDADRVKHSISVSYISSALAMAHGADIEKALLAGLLHDYAKNISYIDQIEFCKIHQIELTEYEKSNPCVIHGKVGALIVMKKFGIVDEEIIGAIYNHVMGKVNMTLLEKIVFVADYIEPERKKIPNIEEIREVAFIDLDKAIAKIYKNIIDYVHSMGKEIDDGSIKAYSYYSGEVIDE